MRRHPPSERAVLFLIGAVQFVNILDFMIVMPLGPDVARALDVPFSHLGALNGSYTAAAAVAGVVGSFFLDRFDRRPALILALAGLAIGTALGGLAQDLPSLLAARVVAGIFGGPATALAFSIVADLVPPERRGKATGAVMGAFSVASVLGVPAGLELAARGGWRAPLLVVAALAAVITAAAAILLPSLRGHLDAAIAGDRPGLRALLSRPAVRLSYATTATVMVAGFLILPNLSAYLQLDLGYPRQRLGLLYLVGGAGSFVVLRVMGKLIDRFGTFRVGTGAAVALATSMALLLVAPPSNPPVLLLFTALMLSLACRNVSYNTLATKVPGPGERARFLSIQSAVGHLASAVGAFGSTRMLTESATRLEGMPRVGGLSMALTVFLPVLLWQVEKRVDPR